MRKLVLSFTLVAVALAQAGVASAQCAHAQAEAHGCIYTNMTSAVATGPLAEGSKVGRACGWNLLNLVAIGDLRIAKAMKDGGITNIANVSAIDLETVEILPVASFVLAPFYAKVCVVVRGE